MAEDEWKVAKEGYGAGDGGGQVAAAVAEHVEEE